MGKISAPQAKNQEPSKPPAQVMEIVLKEEHKAIYDYFVKVLEVKAKLKESKGITDYFILAYKKILLTNVNPEKIRPLSEENFCQFLLSALKEIREKKLAGEEDSKVKQVVEACLDDIRGTEAKDSLIKLVGLPLGIKIDPKNISGSFMDGVKEKILFLGKDKKEEDEPPLSDEEMVTTFLCKSLLPIIVLTAVILLGGLSGPVSVFGFFTIPHVMLIGFAAFGLAAAEYKAVKGLFSNNKKGTLYDPSSQDKDDIEKRAKLNEKIRNGIDDILKTPIKSFPETIAYGGEEPTPEQPIQVGNKGGEKRAMLDGGITLDQPVKAQNMQQSSNT